MVSTSELLLSDRFAPITNSIGFFEGEYAEVVNSFYTWQKLIKKDNINCRDIILKQRENADLASIIRYLLPLNIGQPTKYLFIQTKGNWVAYLDNNYRGTDETAISVLPEYTKKRSVMVALSNYTQKRVNNSWTGAPGELYLSIYGIDSAGFSQLIRHIDLLHDIGRWKFSESGVPLDFENTELYYEKRKANRFSFSLLKHYLEKLGLTPFDENFYLPKGKTEISLIEVSYSFDNQIKKVTLAEARKINSIY
jgi:hypothetical protein